MVSVKMVNIDGVYSTIILEPEWELESIAHEAEGRMGY